VELAFARVVDLSKQDIERKIAFTERVMRFAPTPLIVYRHAALLALKGDHDKAALALARAVGAYPGYLQALSDELDGLDEPGRSAVASLRGKIQEIQRCRTAGKGDKNCQYVPQQRVAPIQ
jgi:hypothetical protein